MKNRFSRFVVITIVAVLLGSFLFSAAAANAEGQELVVVTVPKMIGILWFDSMDVYGQEWADKNNAKHHYIGPTDFDPAQQLLSLNDAVAMRPDILTVVPIAGESVDEVLKKAREAGTTVVTHEGATLQNIDYDVEAFNNKEFGEHFLDMIYELGGEDAEYALSVGRLTVPSHNEWCDALYAAQQEKFPNMKSITGGEYIESQDSADSAYAVGKQLIQTYPKMSVIFTASASAAVGFARAVDEMDMVGKVHVIGLTPPSETVTSFERGSITKGSFWIPGLAQQACYEVGKRLLEGKEIKTGDDLGVPGYENITVDGKVIMGSAWIDIDVNTVEQYVDVI
ncbi:MAG: substrate-binding domain-containing protein [Clostridiales bacterium]|nr:substrate-binding domain-containing protein [Clostridiales bacterium]